MGAKIYNFQCKIFFVNIYAYIARCILCRSAIDGHNLIWMQKNIIFSVRFFYICIYPYNARCILCRSAIDGHNWYGYTHKNFPI